MIAKHGGDGVCTTDPRKNAKARQYVEVFFDEVRKDLRVMDQSAMILARDHGLPLHVFNFDQLETISQICPGEQKFTSRELEPVK
ncbi:MULTISPECIES: hypothetical protein [Brevibacillus]|uniref:amino acid kinase family protein n=1 Tax=Brevibacillus TaxID=55080 RepID=UPI000271BBD3|nr:MULTISPECIES: hypothetical protein [Brevibacillus]ELK38913.1 uridylate kinase [Brevibacillus agri BAB-2500]EJL42080.1 uridylate kinase [Brevibacillus sp. CF112]MBY0050939.1 uridylate kinase [Brevibacillus agri]MDN4095886.1 uridylate kinase [Brevibacillus agri]MDR9507440.1 uridylate kinase [Brevibacillus agri]